MRALNNNLHFLIICCMLMVGACGNQKPNTEDSLSTEKDKNNRSAAETSAKYRILLDIGHDQVFWDDPESMEGKPEDRIERVKYMTNEIKETATAVGAGIGYLREEIKPEHLTNCDLLFIHIPKSEYASGEVKAITEYLKKGGALFVVMDVDYWSSLQHTNVNDLISPFGLQFGDNSPDTLSGGYTKAGPITAEPLKVTYHGGRIVQGGTPFCFNNQTEMYPFGTFLDIEGGGKIIAMGDGMVSLYMTSWQGVDDYQCQEFMQAAFKWLLE